MARNRYSLESKRYGETQESLILLAKANFNWRWKFPMTLPIGAKDYKGDILKVEFIILYNP
jgi:hypothetical protein